MFYLVYLPINEDFNLYISLLSKFIGFEFFMLLSLSSLPKHAFSL